MTSPTLQQSFQDKRSWWGLAVITMVSGVIAWQATAANPTIGHVAEDTGASPLQAWCTSGDGRFHRPLMKAPGRRHFCPAGTRVRITLDLRIRLPKAGLASAPLFPHVVVFSRGTLGDVSWPPVSTAMEPLAAGVQECFEFPYEHPLIESEVLVVALVANRRLSPGHLRAAARRASSGEPSAGVHSRRWWIEVTGLPGDTMKGISNGLSKYIQEKEP